VNVSKKDDIPHDPQQRRLFYSSRPARTLPVPGRALPKAKGIKEYVSLLGGLEEKCRLPEEPHPS
jgi:hypothetical protein